MTSWPKSESLSPAAGDQLGNRRMDLALLTAVAVFLYLLLFRLPYHPFFHPGDSHLFLHDAPRILHGEVLYKDLFGLTFPGTHVVYCLLIFLFGEFYWIMPAVAWTTGVAAFWLVLSISRRLIPEGARYVPALFFVFLGYRWFWLDGSHRLISIVFALMAIWLLLRGRTTANVILAGACCGLASFFTQERGFAVLAGIVVFLIVENRVLDQNVFSLGRNIFVAGIASFLVLSAGCIYFIIAAGFDIFVDSTIRFPANYYKYFPENNYQTLLSSLWRAAGGEYTRLGIVPAVFYTSIVPAVYIVFGVYVWKMRRSLRDEWSTLAGPTLTALVGVSLLLATTAPHFVRIYIVSAPALVVGTWMAARTFRPSIVRQGARSCAVILAALGAFNAYRFQTDRYREMDTPSGKVFASQFVDAELIEWLNDHTEGGDYVFQAYGPNIYFLLGVRNPTRHTQIFMTDYTRPEWIEQTVADLKRNPPRYILWDNSYNVPDQQRKDGDHTKPLADHVMAEYRPVGTPTKNLTQVWERKNPSE